jgi:hypothetical protein
MRGPVVEAHATERAIMELWDAGESEPAIARAVGKSLGTVRRVVRYLDGAGEEATARIAARLGSEALARATAALGRWS